jgi:hypothetical protein
LERILPDHLDPLATGEDDPLDRAQLSLLDLWKGKQRVSRHLLAYDTTNFHTYIASIASNHTRHELAQRGHNKQGRHHLRRGQTSSVRGMRQPIPRQRAAAVERNRQQQHLRDQERRLRDRKQLRPGVQVASAGERFDP